MWTRSFLLLLCSLVAGGPVMAETIVITDGRGAVVVTRTAGMFSSQPADRVVNLNGGQIPPPPPPPPPPDGSIRQQAARWKSLVADYPKRDTHRLALSALHSAMVTRIESGQLTDLGLLKSQTAELVQVFLGSDLSKWDAWARPISQQLAGITTLQEYSQAYEQIAAGLSEGEALSPVVLMVLEIILNILEKKGVNPELLELVRTVLSLLGGLGAEESSLPVPSDDSSHGGHSARYSGGGQGLVAVRPGYIDLRTRRW